MKCFRRAGILDANHDVVSCDLDGEDDPFLEADMQTEVQSLIERTMSTDGCCNVDEYLNDDLPVCMEADSGCWEADFLEQLGQEEQEISNEERPDEDDETDNDFPNSKTHKLQGSSTITG